MKRIIALLLLLLLLTGCTTATPVATIPATEPTAAPTVAVTLPPETEEPTEPALEGLTVHFVDVGQADGFLLECDGEYAVIDGGYPEGGEKMVEYMEELGVEELELVGLPTKNVTRDLHANGPVGIMTGYEEKFHALGTPINRCEIVTHPIKETEE